MLPQLAAGDRSRRDSASGRQGSNAVARRQALPERRIEIACDLLCRAGDRRLVLPGPEMAIGADTEHIAFAGLSQGRLEGADTIDAIGRDPTERHSRAAAI